MYFRQDHLTTGDGARLHFEVHGEGAPAIVLCDGLGCDGFAWKYLLPKLRERHQVVRWHYRGHGLSGVPTDPSRIGMDYCIEDLRAVMDAVGLERAVLFGHSMGVQVSLEFQRCHPERVAGLELLCGAYGTPLDTFHNTDLLKRALPYLKTVIERTPRISRAVSRVLMGSPFAVPIAIYVELNREKMKPRDMAPYFHHMKGMDPVVFFRTLQSLSEHSALDHLPKIDVPTLVIGGEQDHFTPAWLSKKMAEQIPGAELVMVEGGSHTAPLESPEEIWAATEVFLARVGESEVGRERPKRKRKKA